MLRKPTATRRGIVLFTVLAILAVAMIVLGGMLRKLVHEHRQNRLRHEQRQCQRLAEAGLARAELLVTADTAYNGDTWNIAAEELGLADGAVVEIEHRDTSLSATAIYPASGPTRVRLTQSKELDNSNSAGSQP